MADDTSTPAPVTKGYTTSEFWATTVVAIVGIVNQAFGFHIPTEVFATVAGLVATYVISRTIVKKSA